MKKAKMIRVDGKPFTSMTSMFRFESLSDTGWIRIQSIGSENIYFRFKDDAGTEYDGYCKCL